MRRSNGKRGLGWGRGRGRQRSRRVGNGLIVVAMGRWATPLVAAAAAAVRHPLRAAAPRADRETRATYASRCPVAARRQVAWRPTGATRARASKACGNAPATSVPREVRTPIAPKSCMRRRIRLASLWDRLATICCRRTVDARITIVFASRASSSTAMSSTATWTVVAVGPMEVCNRTNAQAPCRPIPQRARWRGRYADTATVVPWASTQAIAYALPVDGSVRRSRIARRTSSATVVSASVSLDRVA